MVKSYTVHNRAGKCVLRTTVGYRYPPDIEMSLLENGYTIKIDGKKLTMKDVKGRVQ